MEYEIFIVYIIFLSSIPLDVYVHPFYRPQIVGLIVEEALTKIFVKYANFADIFFLDLIFKLPKLIQIYNHAIKLVDNQQLSHGPIYSLKPIELKTLKAYIETNLANKFIKLSKLLASTLIFFDWKLDRLL